MRHSRKERRRVPRGVNKSTLDTMANERAKIHDDARFFAHSLAADAKIAALEERLTKRFDARFAAILQDHTALEPRVEARFEALATRVAALETSFEALLQDHAALKTRVAALERGPRSVLFPSLRVPSYEK